MGAERVVKEEAEEVGSDVAEGRAVLEWRVRVDAGVARGC